MSVQTYTVIGLYLDQTPPQRFASSHEARDAQHAENLCLAEYDPGGTNDLTIAGVIPGKHDLTA